MHRRALNEAASLMKNEVALSVLIEGTHSHLILNAKLCFATNR